MIHCHFSGQTDSNKNYKVTGKTDTPLNDTGLQQAESIGQILKEIGFDQAYSSDLSRAKTTCQKILDANKSDIQMQENELIREKSFGQAEEMHYIQFVYLTIIRNQAWPLNYVPKGGESQDDLRQRAKLFIQDVLCKNASFTQDKPLQVLMVSHGEFLRHFFYVLIHDFQCSFTRIERQVFLKSILAPNTSWCQVEITLDSNWILNYNHVIQNVRCLKTWNFCEYLKCHSCNIL